RSVSPIFSNSSAIGVLPRQDKLIEHSTKQFVKRLGKRGRTADMRGMCVVALAHRVHSDWPLILIGNRDEFHARAAAPLHEWDDGSGIVAGRDLQAGGTWLGVHRPSGRVVVVTNVRGAMPDPAKESRGALVSDLLRGAGRFAH